MQRFEADASENQCNPDVVYVPAHGWWCKDCGVFQDVDEHNICRQCRGSIAIMGSPVVVIRKESGNE